VKQFGNIRWWISLLIPILVTACGGGSDSGTAAPDQAQAAATVMIYMVGSDLESKSSEATKNLQQLLAAPSSKNVNVVITTGGANKADPNDLVTDWRVVRRYLVRDGKLQLLADLGKQSMVESATLSDFIVWSKKNYPAKNYRLILWDHGAGPVGFASDEIFPGSLLTLPKLQQALNDAHAQTGIHFDLVGFDACLMATAEVANMLVPYADYLAGSEELEPGSGWDYKAVFSALAAQPTMDALQFGRVITDTFLAGQKSQADAAQAQGALARSDAFITFSVIKLDQVATLVESLRSFGTQLAAYAQQSPANWVRVADERALTSSFGPQDNESMVFDMADLGVFANRLAAANIIPEASRSLSAAVNQAVVYRGNGALASVSTGLSIYFPSLSLNTTMLTDTYAPLDFPLEYKALLQNYVKYASLQTSLISIDASRSSGTTLDAVLKSTFGTKYTMLVRSEPTATPNVVRMLASQPVDSSAGGMQVKANVSEGWPMLNGHPILLDPLGAETREVNGVEKSITSYGLNAYVNGQYAQLIFEKDPDTDAVSYVTAWDLQSEGSTSTADRVTIDLKTTDQITLVNYNYDLGKQAYSETTASTTTFAADQMALTYENATPDAADVRLMVIDFRSIPKLSTPLPVHLQ
jgi:hypothetical protein